MREHLELDDRKACLLLLLACFSYFYNYLCFDTASSIFMGLSDDLKLWISTRYLGVEAMRQFSFPVWDNDYHQAITMITPLYPFNTIFDFICAFLLPVKSIEDVAVLYGWYYFLHYYLMAVFFYLFLRTLNITAYAAIFGAIIYTLNGYSIEKLVSPFFFINLAFVPLFLAYLFKIFSQNHNDPFRKRIVAALPLSLAVLCMVTSGFPLVLLYLSFITIPFLIWKYFDGDITRQQYYRSLSVLGTVVAIGFCIGAPEVYIQLEYVQSLFRYSFDAVRDTQWSIHPLIMLFYPIFPDLFQFFPKALTQTMNYWELAFYFGLSTVIFGWLGIFSKKKENTLFLIILFFSIIYALGIFTSLDLAFYHLLSLSHVPARVPARGMFIVIIALAYFAAVGLQYFVEIVLSKKENAEEMQKVRWLLFSVCTPILLMLCIFLVTLGIPAFNGLIDGDYTALVSTDYVPPGNLFLMAQGKESVLLLGLGYAFLILFLNIFALIYFMITRKKGVAITFFTFVLLFDLSSFGLRLYPPNQLRVEKSSFSKYYMMNEVALAVYRNEKKENHTITPQSFRLYDLVYDGTYTYNTGIQTMAQWDRFSIYPDLIKRFARLCIESGNMTPATDLFNVKYFFIRKSPENLAFLKSEKNKKFELVNELQDGLLVKSRTYKPRVSFADTYKTLNYDALRYAKTEALKTLFQQQAEENPFVYLGSDPQLTLPEITENSTLHYGMKLYTKQRIEIETETSQETLLVLREFFNEKWKAKIDGTDVRVLQTDYFFRAIPLPAGKHLVEFYCDGFFSNISILYILISTFLCLFLFFARARLDRD